MIRISGAAVRSNDKPRSAGKCGQICSGLKPPIADPGDDLNAAINRWIKTHYFPVGRFQLTVAGKPPSELDVRGGQTWRNPSIFAGFPSGKIKFATVDRFVYFGGVDPSAKSRSAPLRGGGRIVI
jgi:hypothetical protein